MKLLLANISIYILSIIFWRIGVAIKTKKTTELITLDSFLFAIVLGALTTLAINGYK